MRRAGKTACHHSLIMTTKSESELQSQRNVLFRDEVPQIVSRAYDGDSIFLSAESASRGAQTPRTFDE